MMKESIIFYPDTFRMKQKCYIKKYYFFKNKVLKHKRFKYNIFGYCP